MVHVIFSGYGKAPRQKARRPGVKEQNWRSFYCSQTVARNRWLSISP